MRKVKLITFIALTLIALVVFFIIAAVSFPWMKKIGPALLQLFSRIVLKIFRVRIDFADRLSVAASRDRGILLIANHISALDIFLMAALYRSVFVSKDEVRRYPVIGLAAALIGIIFLKRESPMDRHRVISKVARESNGRIITIFPQGTTGATKDRLPFKAGIFKTLELNHGAILLPVTIRYKEESQIVWRHDQMLIDNLKAVSAQKSISVKVTLHEPISIAHFADNSIYELCQAAEEKVFAHLQGNY